MINDVAWPWNSRSSSYTWNKISGKVLEIVLDKLCVLWTLSCLIKKFQEGCFPPKLTTTRWKHYSCCQATCSNTDQMASLCHGCMLESRQTTALDKAGVQLVQMLYITIYTSHSVPHALGPPMWVSQEWCIYSTFTRHNPTAGVGLSRADVQYICTMPG